MPEQAVGVVFDEREWAELSEEALAELSLKYRRLFVYGPGQKLNSFFSRGPAQKFRGQIGLAYDATRGAQRWESGQVVWREELAVIDLSALKSLQRLETLIGAGIRDFGLLTLRVKERERIFVVHALKELFLKTLAERRQFPKIHFLNQIESRWWNAQTQNPFNGPIWIDIDVANTCTHNCVFCGFYGPEFLARDRTLAEDDQARLRKAKSLRVDPERVLSLIRSLPISAERIQFGGAGDPGTHPRFMDFIRYARNRGLKLEILTNFSYFTLEQIEELSRLSEETSIKMFINISAASSEVYTKIRPNQTAKNFERNCTAIKFAGSLYKQERRSGLGLISVNIINRDNFREMPAMVELAKNLGMHAVWFKPLQVFENLHRGMLPAREDGEEFASALKLALDRADRLGVEIFDRNMQTSLMNWLGEIHEENQPAL